MRSSKFDLGPQLTEPIVRITALLPSVRDEFPVRVRRPLVGSVAFGWAYSE